MEIVFEQPYLRELFEEGKTKNKKHRYQPSIIVQYRNAINKLRAASKIEDLYALKSLNYEKLKGDKVGLESIRVNNKYRIEFKSRISGIPPNTITICAIIELSPHYND